MLAWKPFFNDLALPDHTRPLKLYQKPFYAFGAGVCFSCSSPSLITELRNSHSQYSNPAKNEKAEPFFIKFFQKK